MSSFASALSPVKSSFATTAPFAGILGLAFAVTNLIVVYSRVAAKKYYGTDKNTSLEFKVRAAGTIGEYSSVGILLLALVEAREAVGPKAVWWLAAAFTISRLLHALQLGAPRSVPLIFRAAGAHITIGIIAFCSFKLFTSK